MENHMTSGKNVGCQIQIRTTKVRFEKNRMYTSGGAIDIKYEKKCTLICTS